MQPKKICFIQNIIQNPNSRNQFVVNINVVSNIEKFGTKLVKNLQIPLKTTEFVTISVQKKPKYAVEIQNMQKYAIYSKTSKYAKYAIYSETSKYAKIGNIQ